MLKGWLAQFRTDDGKLRVPDWARPTFNLDTILEAMGVLGLFIILMTVIQYATPGLVGTDGYYHVGLAHQMRIEGLVPDFVWLPLTILNPQAYYDHHFLYHIYLALFVPASPVASTAALISGGKIASAILPALAFLAIWWLLRGQGVRYAWLWALALFAVSDAFLYRMSMPRAQSGSLLVLALGLHWLLKERLVPLVLLGFVYVWLYNAFPLLLVVGGVYAVAVALTERRIAWKPLAAITLGLALGVVINPYFPRNVTFIISHILPKIGDPGSQVGNEWAPYDTWVIFRNSTAALALTALGAFAMGWNRERVSRPVLTAFGLVLVFGVMFLKSRRFVEYFPAFALIFGALSLAPLLDELEAGWASRGKWARWILPVGLALLLAFPLGRSISRARNQISGSEPVEKFAAATAWLIQNSPEGSLVFQLDWDEFPRLFFYNRHNIYTIGLDVTYMELYDAELYQTWDLIRRGYVEHPGEQIASRFGASYVFGNPDRRAFASNAEGDPYLREVYRDQYAVIWEVVEQP